MLTVVISVHGRASRFAAASSAPRFVFYLAIASLIMPGLLVSLGIGLTFQFLGLPPNW